MSRAAPIERLPAEPRPDTAKGGFSMVEVIIATIILAVGVLGYAGSTAFQVRQVTLADLMTERAAAFQTVIDRLQSLPYDSVDTGADSVGIYSVEWSITNDGSQSKIVHIVTAGPGIVGSIPMQNPIVVDTFNFRLLRR